MNSTLAEFGALDSRLATHCRLLSLRRYELQARIGVHDFEHQAPQRMWFDVDVCVRLSDSPAQQDHISQTLDYDFIRVMISQTVGFEHHELQETLCDGLLAQLMAHPQVQAARVNTRKPDVYPDCESVGTERIGLKPWPSV